MALDPRIPGMVQMPEIVSPQQHAATAMQTRRAQQIMAADDMKLRAGQQELAERDAFLRELRNAPDLSNDTLDRLTRVAPTVAMEFRKNLQAQRTQALAEAKAQAELEAKQAERGFSLLAALDEETYPVLMPAIAKLLPDVAPALGQQYDPAAVEKVRRAGLTVKEQLEADAKALEALAKGEYGALAGAMAKISDPAERKERLTAWGFLGAPRGVLEALTADPSSFEMSPEKRETLAGQAEGRAIQRDGHAITVRGQDLSAATARRGQDLSAATARRGQDMSAATSAATQPLEEVIGPDGKPVLVRRSEAVGKAKPAAAGAAGAKAGPDVNAIMREIETLSSQINTASGGPGANLQGMVRRGLAAVNADNTVAEYEALINGMIPMVARAVGHSGVLTQADVDSVRALFPQVGDNQALAKSKISRVKALLAGTSPAAAPAVAPAGSTETQIGGFKVRIKGGQ